MYLPSTFDIQDLAIAHEVIERHSFATLVTTADGVPFASHLPLMLDASRGPFGTLTGHVARANPHWRAFGEAETLAIFQGPHAYISPGWYDARPAVPTWDYAAVHAYGCPQLLEDAGLERLLARMVELYEAERERPWRLDGPDEFLRKMRSAVVGFDLPIARLETKLKMSQNRPEGDRARIVDSLRESGDPNDAGVAAWIERLGRAGAPA